MEELLPALQGSHAEDRYRLVSPSHHEGRDLEFFLCGQDGKRRARYRPGEDSDISRGDILIGAEVRGDARSSRVESIERKA